MKCPECGSVSSSVIPQCEQCGHRFRLAANSETPSPSSKLVQQAAGSRTHLDSAAPAWIPVSEKAAAGEAPSDPAPTAQLPQNNLDPTATEERWRNDLTQRVQRFRSRRAHLRGSSDAETTLEFDFDGGSGEETDTLSGPALVQPAQSGKGFDAVLRADERLKENIPAVDSIPLRGQTEALESPPGAVDVDAEADGLPVQTRRRRLDPAAMSIVMESSPADEPEPAPLNLPVAPLGRRFLAGVADGLTLLFALACFVAVFWWVVGGRLHLRPADLGVLGFVAGSLILSYFALFGRLASATPGQQAAGLVLRNLEGGTPTPAQAFWRAFGYLVSLSALMLGFVWALVDSEGLTWHDRMSGTLLASRDQSVRK